MTDSPRMVPSLPGTADRGWSAVPHPALVVDLAGVIRSINHAARTLFPDLSPGDSLTDLVDWLGEAHRRFLVDPATAPVRPHALPTDATELDAELGGLIRGRRIVARPVRDGDLVTWWLTDNTDIRMAMVALARERRRTALLSDASAALMGSLNPRLSMEVVARLAAEHLGSAAFVLAPISRRTGGYPAVLCRRGGRPERLSLDVDPADLPGLAEALQGFPPVPSRWIDPATAPDWVMVDDIDPVNSIVVIPLPGHGVPAGALVLLRAEPESTFTAEEETFARLFAARSGAAMSAARMFAQQATVTETLMRELLPPRLEQLGGVEYAGRYRAARDGERVGGDFYDVHSATVMPDADESLAVLGDVCGKGLEAAMLTGKIRTTVGALLPHASDHQHMLNLLNSTLLNTNDTQFVTMVLVSAKRLGTSVRLRITCAGHPPALVVRSGGRVEEVDSAGSLVGVLPTVTSNTAEVLLAPGETCVLYTDGILEARGGPLGDAMFGEQRLRQVLADCAELPAEAVAERVQMLALQWVGDGPHDDMAVVAISAPRGNHLAAVGGHGRGRYTA